MVRWNTVPAPHHDLGTSSATPSTAPRCGTSRRDIPRSIPPGCGGTAGHQPRRLVTPAGRHQPRPTTAPGPGSAARDSTADRSRRPRRQSHDRHPAPPRLTPPGHPGPEPPRNPPPEATLGPSPCPPLPNKPPEDHKSRTEDHFMPLLAESGQTMRGRHPNTSCRAVPVALAALLSWAVLRGALNQRDNVKCAARLAHIVYPEDPCSAPSTDREGRDSAF